jgi:hypothetical protein
MRRRAGILVAVGILCVPSRSPAQITFNGGPQISRAEHRVSDGGSLVTTSGTLLGGALALAVRDQFEITVEVWGGRLSTAGSPSVEDHDLAEVQLIGGFRARPWLTLEAGPVLRSYSNVLARQHWTTLRAGAEARLPLAMESIHGIVRGYWMPIVSVNELSRPEIALATSVGVEWQGSRVTVGMTYTLERYDFRASAGARRLEQLSSLHLRAGLRWPR